MRGTQAAGAVSSRGAGSANAFQADAVNHLRHISSRVKEKAAQENSPQKKEDKNRSRVKADTMFQQRNNNKRIMQNFMLSLDDNVFHSKTSIAIKNMNQID